MQHTTNTISPTATSPQARRSSSVALTVVLLFILAALVGCGTAKHVQSSTTSTINTAANRLQAQRSAHAQPQPTLNYSENRRYNALFLEAIRQKEAEHYDAECELLEAALAIQPYAPEALFELGVIKLSYTPYMDTLSRAQGDTLMQRAVELAPDNLYYKETLATFQAYAGEIRNAINLYEEIADANETEENLRNLENLYRSDGDYAGCIRTIERLERIGGRTEELSLEKFQTYIAMNDNENAYKAIEDLCAEYPYDLRYRVLLGDLYDQHGYHEQALNIYRDVLTAEPDNGYAQISLLAYYKAAKADSLYYNLLRKVVLNPHSQSDARFEAMRGFAVDNIRQKTDSTKVLNLFREILAQPQQNREMAELYAYYLDERGLPSDSVVDALNLVLIIEPDYTKARLQLLQIMLQRDNMDQVISVCRDGELYDPAEVTFYYYEANALYRQGNDNAALRQLERAVERITDNTDPILASNVCALQGDILYGAKLHEEAFLAYDEALIYNGYNLLCLNNYAFYLALTGTTENLEKALQMSRQTIEIDEDEPHYLDTYAWILYLSKRYDEAKTYSDEALTYTQPTAENASIYDHAGDIAFRSGDRTSAIANWKQALKLTTNRTAKYRIQQKIAKKRI